MIQAFPVSLVAGLVGGRNARGHRCPSRVTYTDTHVQPRAGGLLHHAQDIFAPEGSHVLSPVDGVVSRSSADTGATEKGGHHLSIEVRSRAGDVVRTYYLAHLRDAPLVRVGDRVLAGQHVGFLGKTGNAARTCPHLHISARRFRRGAKVNIYSELVAVDPMRAPSTLDGARKKEGGK